jgi:hypothetical protein
MAAMPTRQTNIIDAVHFWRSVVHMRFLFLFACLSTLVFAQSGYNSPDINQPLYKVPAGPDSITDMGPGSGSPPAIESITSYEASPAVPSAPSPHSQNNAAAARISKPYDSSAYIGTNGSGGYHMNGSRYSYSIAPNGSGGYYVSGPTGSYFINANGSGGYDISGPKGLSYMSPDGSGGYNISGAEGSWTVKPNGMGGYNITGPEGSATVSPSGGGYNVSGPVNPAYVIPALRPK